MHANRIGLVYSEDYQKYNFGPSHPLRPLRLKLTYSLMEKIGLLDHERLDILKPRLATREEITRAHAIDYVDAVQKLSNNPSDKSIKADKYNLGPGDNPIFKGMYEASSLVCGASIVAADKVWNENEIKIAFNPAGGLHHAMKDKASGFCIFNDIAAAIYHLKSIKKDIKIAYLDIDCHHGDGVQWLFYDDPNVLTIDYHQSGRSLFPGSGEIDEIGEGAGKGYSINFPLLPKTPNKVYLNLFRKTTPRILEAYQPDILITQLGVDTYYNDPLTDLGLSLKVYWDFAQTMKTSAKDYCNNKWLALGGGGYLMTVVPRAWTIFLAKMLGVWLENVLPVDWIDEVRADVRDEATPTELWDLDFEVQTKLMSNVYQDYYREINEYTRSLIETCENEFLPILTKA